MAYKYNPFTGNLDYYESATGIELIKDILLDSTPDATYPTASILFDADSILYNDDNEEL